MIARPSSTVSKISGCLSKPAHCLADYFELTLTCGTQHVVLLIVTGRAAECEPLDSFSSVERVTHWNQRMRARGTLLHSVHRHTTGTDHPRARGERLPSTWCRVSPSGSSPRDHLYVTIGRVRIIPAHAGNAARTSSHEIAQSDHPRAINRVKSLTGSGSSPCARGTLFLAPRLHRQVRIIPARAGNAIVAFSRSKTTPDHPRAVCAN